MIAFRPRTVSFHTIDSTFESIHTCYNCNKAVKDTQVVPFVKLSAGHFWCSEKCFKQEIVTRLQTKPQQESLM